MANKFFTGDDGSATYGGTVFNITGWTANYERDLLSTNGTADSGYDTDIPGRRRLSGTVNMNYDADNDPFSASGLNTDNATTSLVAMVLKMQAGDDTSTTITCNVQFSSLAITSQVGTVVSVTGNWKAKGSFSLPGGF